MKKSEVNILYIGTPNSIHDIKWMSFFSVRKDYNIYVISEEKSLKSMSNYDHRLLKDFDINLLLRPLDFSFSNPVSTIKSLIYLRKFIKEKNIQIVHTLFGTPHPIWLNFIGGVKKIITTRGSDILLMMPQIKNSSWRNIHLKALFNQLVKSYKLSDYVTSTSLAQLEAVKEIGVEQSKCLIIKTGVDVREISELDENEYLPEILKGKKLIFSPRFIKPIYNLDYQIDAIRLLPNWVKKKYVFVFVKGNFPFEEYFKRIESELRKIKDLKIEIFIEPLTQNEIWSIIKKSELVYMVPQSDGTPNTALETMASKTKLIMPNLPYNTELFDAVSIIADLDCPKSLTKCIEIAINDYPQGFLDNGFEKVSNHGSRYAEMTKLESLYLS